MRKSVFFIIVAVSLAAGSCKKWLQVEPEDKFTEAEIYSSAQSIADAMNGIYLQLADSKIYGRNLTLDKLDLFAQRYYEISTSNSYYYYSQWDYANTDVKQALADIWAKMYATIGNVNLFITDMELYGKQHLSTSTYNIYMGAAYGLRAYMHFDLLRMFGPVYSDANKDSPSIPYYKKFDGKIQSYASSADVIKFVLSDIDSAESFLADDPIVSQKGVDNLNNYRFNFYAAKALKARVYLWTGDKADALAAAQEVIAAQSNFPWVTLAGLTNIDNPDRKFFTETIFNIFNQDLYDLFNQLFAPSLNSNTILATGESNQVDKVFEGNQADYRYVYSWPYPASGSVSFRTFIKYEDISNPNVDSSVHSRFGVPLIRISEMYYIAAECDPDQTEALEYLNTVRRNRGLPVDITDYTTLNAELEKEYQKEFFGEGQLWYYYKRTSIATIPTPNSVSGTISIPLSSYVFPLPDDESIGR